MMKSKVGILSMQRVINYGSFLQAYALKRLLLLNGADSVEFIDIIPGRALPGYESSGLPFYIRRFKDMMKVILSGRAMAKKKTMAFMGEVANTLRNAWPQLGLESYPHIPEVDLAVIGSDEVFHCCQPTKWGFTSQLYGKIPSAKEVVSYAASFGGTKLQEIYRLGIGEEIADNINRLSHISVRDENSKSIVEALTGRSPRMNIDPVLAYGYKNEIEEAGKVDESNYILLYSYPDRINDPMEIKAIREFAQRIGKKLICVMSRYDWCDRAIIPTPLELLGWYKNADMVITETFHGTIFSIITHRQFATIGRPSAMPKLTSMLKPYGLENRLVTKERPIDRIFESNVDYENVELKLSKLRKETEEYLKIVLQ